MIDINFGLGTLCCSGVINNFNKFPMIKKKREREKQCTATSESKYQCRHNAERKQLWTGQGVDYIANVWFSSCPLVCLSPSSTGTEKHSNTHLHQRSWWGNGSLTVCSNLNNVSAITCSLFCFTLLLPGRTSQITQLPQNSFLRLMFQATLIMTQIGGFNLFLTGYIMKIILVSIFNASSLIYENDAIFKNGLHVQFNIISFHCNKHNFFEIRCYIIHSFK